MENESTQNKKVSYIVEIAFVVLVTLTTCPLIPFFLTIAHPRFILPYILCFPFVLISTVILLIVAVTLLLFRLRKTPKIISGIKAAILVLAIVFGFLWAHTIPWWDAAAHGMYCNLKSADFTELRTWADSVRFPVGENYLHLMPNENIPSAPAKFKPFAVWVRELDNQKGRVTSIVWCGGLFGHVELVVGPPDMPTPTPDPMTNSVQTYRTVSPGAYISITE